MHPHTYLNKVVVSYDDGSLELWNIRTLKKIFSFNPKKWVSKHEKHSTGSKKKDDLSASVNCVVQSPAVDVVGLGLNDGRIVLLNLRTDKVLGVYRQDDGPVIALSFRSDGRQSTLASASKNGTVVIWDLDKRQLQSMLRFAHNAAVTSIFFLPGEPLLVTVGEDNAIKMWIFDQPDNTARLLRERQGHSSAPRKIQFYGTQGENIISAGNDRSLRTFNIHRDRQSGELSQGSIRSKADNINVSVESLRLPPVLQFAASPAKERDWANIITCHEQTDTPHVWSHDSKTIVARTFKNTKRSSQNITAVALSACGNFGIIGTAEGSVERYNMQSGFLRGKYELEDDAPAHEGAVHGVAADGLNRYVVSAGYDGVVRFWDFLQCKVKDTVELNASVNAVSFNRDSDLLAVSTDDLEISIFDCITAKVVRRFRGYTSSVSDMAFSPDGRWLAVASMDGGLRVFDLPSGQLVDWFSFQSPATSIAFSPIGDFLATSHVNNLGIYLWANKQYFSSVYLRGTPEAPVEIDLPRPDDDESGVTAGDNEGDAPELAGSDKPLFEPMELASMPMDDNLVVLSEIPRAKWSVLPHLETVKARNKPKEAPQATPDAPFFLSTVAGLKPEFVKNEDNAMDEEKEPVSRILSSKGHIDHSTFMKAVYSANAAATSQISQKAQAKRKRKTSSLSSAKATTTDVLTTYAGVNALLKEMSAAAIDAEFKSIGLSIESESDDIGAVLDYFAAMASTPFNYEYTQVLLNVFLKAHSDVIVQYPVLLEKVERIYSVQKATWEHLEGAFQKDLCLVKFFTKTE